ncbi:T9SS type A sorting domain-containing protein [Flavobacterium fluviale]|uniref:T9SS C-terminal target domain-containing protein n=1 Tax=Flavobacterium fluviale TaxID=2249356 RepID=A0A344LPS8_9FLAO|nr:T9SS type A sorting domain-containing protein [Flavobacterium fluviale]AXB55920.1 T9SS C-terminal target domain-containing protein [Flavobacterium fluviale]
MHLLVNMFLYLLEIYKKQFMKKTLLILLFPLLSIGQTQIGTDINGETAQNYSGSSISLSSDGRVVAISASVEAGNGADSGQVRVFKNISGVWIQQGQAINGKDPYDSSGDSLSLSSDGSVVAIGSRYNDRNGYDSGQVRVYKNVSGVWTQVGADISGKANEDYSGWSVSLSADGTVVAIGAPGNDGSEGYRFYTGQVRIFKNISGVWTQIGADIYGEGAFDQSGDSVSLSADGNVVAIGAIYNKGNGTDSGHVRIYKNVSGVWTKIGADIDGKAIYDRIGSKLSLSADGNVVAIGRNFNESIGYSSSSGQVRVYKNVSNVWTQQGADINGEAISDSSGSSVSLSSDGSVVAIGAPYNAGNGQYSGHVRIYKNVSGVWIQLGFDIDGKAVGDRSGSSVSLSSNGNVVAIGAPLSSENGNYSGQVRVFDLSAAVLSSASFVLSSSSVYPNPSSDIVNIDLNQDLTLQKVNIYNTLGQLIKTENSNSISVSSLSTGVYFFEIITDRGKETKTVLVK